MSKWYCIGLLLTSSLVVAQEADSLKTMYLSEVVINEGLLKDAEIGLSEEKLDSLALEQLSGNSLADLLRTSAGGQLRAYGSNGLATPSFRGTGGNHTAILWNGINLQSPLSGAQDLSLIPNTFLDQVSIQKGGSSTIYGSGAIGGTIQLTNRPKFNQGFGVRTSQQLGSFGNYFQSYNVSYGAANFYSSTSIFRKTIDNDYPYLNVYTNPASEEIRSNAGLHQWGVLQQNSWRLNTHNMLIFKLWYQDNELEVPTPVVASNESEALQKDQFVRGIFNWNHDREKWSLEYKLAFVDHNLTYFPTAGDTSFNDYQTWINRLVTTFDLDKKSVLTVGINHSYNVAVVKAFGPEKLSQNATALFASYRIAMINSKLNTALNVRQELVDGDFLPLILSLGNEYQLSSQILLKSNISTNYRIPTFNELYWQGSGAMGNPDLQPEESFNAEVGIDWMTLKSSHWSISTHATLYHSMVDNWVQWQQSNSIWSPVNLKKVWSRGLETKLAGNYSQDELNLSMEAAYNFTKTSNKELAEGVNENVLDNQLTYTPIHEASALVHATFKKFMVSMDHAYTGKQYTEDENRDRFALDAYQITNFSLGYNTEFGKIGAALNFRVNNAFDTTYENRRGYPMYGRNYLFELNLSFNN